MPGGGQQQQRAKVDPVYSPDGSKIVFVATHDGDPELYIADADGQNVTKLTDNESVDASPKWAPDGSHIVFVSDRDGDFSIYTMQPDGSDLQLLELRLPSEAAAENTETEES
jgi:TolB protein